MIRGLTPHLFDAIRELLRIGCLVQMNVTFHIGYTVSYAFGVASKRCGVDALGEMG